MKPSLIAARSLNNIIGNDSDIPWQAKGEQALFKEITMHSVLIMGRKTFEAIGRPLPDRTTIIVTRNADYHHPGCETSASLEQAIEAAELFQKPVFIAGGGEIYRQGLPLVNSVHLTTIQCKVEGNIRFPDFPTEQFRLINEKFFESNINYLYQYYERKLES